MALIDQVPKILEFIDNNKDRVTRAKDKLNILEGELLPYVEEAMLMELSPEAFQRSKNRIAPINFMPKVINKLSPLYDNTVIRNLSEEDDSNQSILDYYVDKFNLNNSGKSSNKQLNLNKYTAWEIYLSEDDQPKLRTLPAHQFLVYSDDIEDPTNPTVFIKILGKFSKDTGMIDETSKDPIYTEVIIYKLYSDEEIIVVDSEGEQRNEFMIQNPEGINPFGTIPFVYINDAEYTLLPLEDTSDIPMIVLIPLLFTDLNYATQFMSHSIIYAVDAELGNISGNPDSIWIVKSDPAGDDEKTNKAEIGTIKPEVDIEQVINLIQTQLALWLDSKGIKAQGVGKLEVANLASGISKMIDEGDTTKAVKAQSEIYKKAEKKLFKKIIDIHNTWVDQGIFVGEDVNTKLPEDFKVITEFEEPQVVVNEKERIETIKIKQENRYTSYKRALQEANPELDSEQLEELMAEIDQDIEENRTITVLETGENDGRDSNGTGNNSTADGGSEEQEEGEEENQEEEN